MHIRTVESINVCSQNKTWFPEASCRGASWRRSGMPLPYPLTSMGLKTTQLHLNSRGSIVFCFFPLDPWGGVGANHPLCPTTSQATKAVQSLELQPLIAWMRIECSRDDASTILRRKNAPNLAHELVERIVCLLFPSKFLFCCSLLSLSWLYKPSVVAKRPLNLQGPRFDKFDLRENNIKYNNPSGQGSCRSCLL